jgi:hypothetical protein
MGGRLEAFVEKSGDQARLADSLVVSALGEPVLELRAESAPILTPLPNAFWPSEIATTPLPSAAQLVGARIVLRVTGSHRRVRAAEAVRAGQPADH